MIGKVGFEPTYACKIQIVGYGLAGLLGIEPKMLVRTGEKLLSEPRFHPG